MVFYAHACGLDYSPTNTWPSVRQVYALLQHNHWYRTMLYVNNTWSASRGAIWMRFLLQLIKQHRQQKAENRKDNSVDVTIIVGHDFDLDNVATALGLNWRPRHYKSHHHLLATPPGSGLYWKATTTYANGVLKSHKTKVDLQFVAPVYHDLVLDRDDPWQASRSGTLFSVPVEMLDFDDNNAKAINTTANRNSILSLTDWENRVATVLSRRWPIANQCFVDSQSWVAEKLRQSDVDSDTVSLTSFRRSVLVFMFVSQLWLLIGVAAWYLSGRRSSKEQTHTFDRTVSFEHAASSSSAAERERQRLLII